MDDNKSKKDISDEMNKGDDQTLNELSDELKRLHVPQLNGMKLLVLGLLAFFFSSLEPFALFASIPFTLSFLLYGNLKTIGMGLLGTLFSLLLLQVKVFQGSALGTYPLAVIYGFLISSSIKRKEHPYRGVVINGMIIFTLVMIVLGLFEFKYEGGIRGFLTPYIKETATHYYDNYKDAVDAASSQLRQLQDVIQDPRIVVDPILNYGVGFIFVGIFLSFWVGTFMILKLSELWRPFHIYPYSRFTMTHFRVPFEVTWPLIAALVFTVGSLYGHFGEWAEWLGFNMLLMLGIFYFFQGFGVLCELLNAWKIFGFLRSMIIISMVIMAYQILSLVGVLDTWVDFRRFFKTNNNEGDKL